MDNKLVTDNLGYVITLARQYKSDILSTDDLISEGTIGMMKAAQKYDPQRGKPFVTFAAPYIRQAIEQAISRLDTPTDVRSTDESLPRGSRNNYTLLNVLEDKDSPRADAASEQMLSDDMRRATAGRRQPLLWHRPRTADHGGNRPRARIEARTGAPDSQPGFEEAETLTIDNH